MNFFLFKVPKKDCKQVPHQDCKQVPRTYTDYETEEVCNTSYRSVCRPVPVNKCHDEQEAVTTLFPKENCYNKPRKVRKTF